MTSWKALSLPPLDHELSPHTGFTRAHWEAVADHWVNVALSYASPRFSLIEIPGRHSWSGTESDALEGFARSFLIAAPRIAGGDDPHGFAEKYASGLVAGTERGGSEGWLWAADAGDPTGKAQPIVEAAGLAYALHISRAQIWDRLKPAEQERVAEWLAHHARRFTWPNNWLLFTAVIEAFLASVGVDTSEYDGSANLRRVESWYAGQGWYTDGQRRNFDYYNAWVIHPLLWAIYDMVPDREPDAAWRWENRLGRYLESYAHLFGGDGSPLIQGRSIIYRTATLAPIWLGQLTGRTPLSPGASRRLASGTLKHFVDNGVGVDGPLSLGWHAGQYLDVTQPYSGPGSPYWAGIGFHGLALPADHPVWTAKEEAQPVETGDHVVELDATGWLVSSTADDAIVRVYNHGADHHTAGTPEDDPLYMKYAYSSATAPGTGTAFTANVDGAFVLLDGEPSRRGPILRHRVRGSVAGSTCAPREGALLSSVSIVNGPFEVRCHLLEGDRPTDVREGSWAVASGTAVPHGVTDGVAWARRADGLTAALLPLHGYDRAETITHEGGNVLGVHMSTPVAFGRATPKGSLHVALHFLGRTGDVSELGSTMKAVSSISIDGVAVRVEWRDGQVMTVDVGSFIG